MQLEQLVTDADWAEIVHKAVDDAKLGDYVARQWLTPYIAGKVPDEVNTQVQQVIEIVYHAVTDSQDPTLPAPATPGAAADHR